MTTGNDPKPTQEGVQKLRDILKISPEERAEMLVWCPTEEQADALFEWTREKGIAAVCLKRIERMEAELDAIKKELAKI